MDTLHRIGLYLSDSELVAQIQKYYGVERIPPSLDGKSPPKNSSIHRKTVTANDNNCHNNKKNEEKEDISDTEVDDTLSSESDPESVGYRVTNWFWFYLFTLGTALGDELFYATFIPFWFWNVDGAVGRRMLIVWAVTMYVGQGIKDILCIPRPGPPAVRMQKKWSMEYGMPSTHAMVSIAIPFSVLVYTMNRYQYPFLLGLFAALLWCSVICVSRVYLGMHSVLDIVVGLILAAFLLIPLIPIVDRMDWYLLTSRWSPFCVLAVSIGLVVFYPKCEQWTPTRGDTAMVLSVTAGVQIGAWTNYQFGAMTEAPTPPPYAIIWPSYEMCGLCLLRTAIGLSCILATRAFCKWASYATICALLRLNSKDIKRQQPSVHNRQKTIVDLSYKFITSMLIGLNTLCLMPNVFQLLGISRPTFYTEI